MLFLCLNAIQIPEQATDLESIGIETVSLIDPS